MIDGFFVGGWLMGDEILKEGVYGCGDGMVRVLWKMVCCVGD